MIRKDKLLGGGLLAILATVAAVISQLSTVTDFFGKVSVFWSPSPTEVAVRDIRKVLRAETQLFQHLPAGAILIEIVVDKKGKAEVKDCGGELRTAVNTFMGLPEHRERAYYDLYSYYRQERLRYWFSSEARNVREGVFRLACRDVITPWQQVADMDRD